MILNINNIGILENASVQIDGITVIAGENGTGKSTLGRALYAVFNSFHNIQSRIKREQIDSVEGVLDRVFTEEDDEKVFDLGFDISSIAESIVNQKDNLEDDNIIESIIKTYDEELLEKTRIEMRREAYAKIRDMMSIPKELLVNSLTGKEFLAEFNGQISNIYSEKNGSIQLEIKNNTIDLLVQKNDHIIVNKYFNLYTEAIYLDDPLILDEIRAHKRYLWANNYESHRTKLRRLLEANAGQESIVKEILVNEKLNQIYQKISYVCDGEIVPQKGYTFGYRKDDDRKTLSIANLSTGLKTFVILKTLLIKGLLEENGTIILDEPEIHLHPNWQLLFAELIVLLHKEFKMHILLNTHSPYFVRAIQVYSEKYGVSSKCNYYLAEADKQIATIKDVTNYIEKIYEKLYIPLQTLEDLRWRDE